MRSVLVVAVCLSTLSSLAAEPGCGDVKGRFVFDGDPPKPEFIRPAPGGGQILNESLLVDPQTKGVANGFAWVRRIDFATVPPELMKVPAEPADLDVQGDAFVPHALVVRAGQRVRLLNADPHPHVFHSNPVRGRSFNVFVAANDRVGAIQRVGDRELMPIPIMCDVYPWMRAHMLVLDHPYGVVSDVDGEFEIKDLPAGEHEFRFWHERAGYLEKGRVVTVQEGETTDLGDIKVKPK